MGKHVGLSCIHGRAYYKLVWVGYSVENRGFSQGKKNQMKGYA
jgi:hypothetical protein